ncbi:MAG: helicase, partial [Lachnospiraceae bacterium]|nr:helicase [Lachnospiraceae bacterium]
VQTRLIALHHIDVPWRPSDIEQQEGRILRQGNQNERVKIFRYVTENTFDSYSWQLIENKQKFIGQIMTSKSPVRSCDDVDEAALSYAEVKALATGNPYIKEKMTLDTEVAKLKLMKANFKSQKYRLEDDITKGFPRRIAALQEKIEGTKQDIVTRDTNQSQSDDEFAITVNGMTYTDKKDGGAALIAAVKDTKNIDREKVGRYCGFDLYGRFDVFANGFRVYMQGKMEHILDISSDPHGMITRLNNCMASFDRTLTEAEEALADTCAKLETAKTEVTKEFDKEDILTEKLERLSFLNAQLDIDKNGEGGGQPEENSIENESHEVKDKTEYKEVRVSNVVHERKSGYMRL